MRSVYFIPIASFLFSSACQEALDAELEQLRDRAMLECGRFTYGSDCNTGQDEGLACMRNAASSCQHAHLQTITISDEGGKVFTDYFIKEGGADCSIVAFTDTRQDAWSSQTLVKRTCANLGLIGPTTSGCELITCKE